MFTLICKIVLFNGRAVQLSLTKNSFVKYVKFIRGGAKKIRQMYDSNFYFMASSPSRKDESYTALRWATREGKMGLSCMVGTSRCILQEELVLPAI